MSDLFYIIEIGHLRLHVFKNSWNDMTDVQRNQWISDCYEMYERRYL